MYVLFCIYHMLMLNGLTFCNIYEKPMKRQSVIRVTPRTKHELEQVVSLLESIGNNVDIWKYPSSVNSSIDFRLSSSDLDDITPTLKNDGLEMTVQIADVGKLIKRQAKERRRKINRKSATFHDVYHTLTEWIDRMVSEHSDKVSTFVVGYSYYYLPLRAIKISTKVKTSDRKALWLHAGGHAREWISPATLMYITEQLLTQYDQRQFIRDAVDQYDWYILPVYNPDGYFHSWIDSETRLWRKTFRRITSVCFGVDPNRNWDAVWGGDGSSTDPCSSIYRGSGPFSEPETKSIAEYIQSLDNVVGFLDFHAYSQIWLTPWSYTSVRPPNYEEQMDVSSMVVDALSWSRGTSYTYGNSPEKLYVASGVSADWAYSKAGIVHSYIVELPDTGQYGFLLPSSQIIPTGTEMLDGVVEFASLILSYGRNRTDNNRGPPNFGQP